MSLLVPFPPLRQETLRAIVVVGDHGETAVALRDALPREMVVILDARPLEAAAAIAVCRPCPWALLWESVVAPIPTAPARSPTIVLAGASVPGLPDAERWTSYRGLLERLRAMLARVVGGMRLAPGAGVELPDGSISRSAWLQAMLSNHPAGVPAPHARVRAAQAMLRVRGAGWTAARRADGTVALVREEAAA